MPSLLSLPPAYCIIHPVTLIRWMELCPVQRPLISESCTSPAKRLGACWITDHDQMQDTPSSRVSQRQAGMDVRNFSLQHQTSHSRFKSKSLQQPCSPQQSCQPSRCRSSCTCSNRCKATVSGSFAVSRLDITKWSGPAANEISSTQSSCCRSC